MLLVFDEPTRQPVPNRAVRRREDAPRHAHARCEPRVRRASAVEYGHAIPSARRDGRAARVMPGPRPEGNALSSDERTLFVANRGDDTLVEIDTDTMTCGRRVKTRSDPNRIYRTSAPDGRDLLLLTNSGERSISVFDARQLEEIERIALPANPTALSFHPSRRVAYVSFRTTTCAARSRYVAFRRCVATLRGSMRRTCSRGALTCTTRRRPTACRMRSSMHIITCGDSMPVRTIRGCRRTTIRCASCSATTRCCAAISGWTRSGTRRRAHRSSRACTSRPNVRVMRRWRKRAGCMKSPSRMGYRRRSSRGSTCSRMMRMSGLPSRPRGRACVACASSRAPRPRRMRRSTGRARCAIGAGRLRSRASPAWAVLGSARTVLASRGSGFDARRCTGCRRRARTCRTAVGSLGRGPRAMATRHGGAAASPRVTVKISELGLRDAVWNEADNARIIRDTIAIFGAACSPATFRWRGCVCRIPRCCARSLVR